MRTFLLAAAALVTLGACATADDSAEAVANRDCFRNEDVFGYSVVDDHTVAVRASSKTYWLTTEWDARDLDWTHHIAIRSSTGWICTGNGLGVDLIGGTPRRTYPVASITRVPEEPAPTGS